MAKTNIFQWLKHIGGPGKWQISADIPDDGLITGTVLFTPYNADKAAAAKLRPLTFSGTAEELAEGFLDGLTAPVNATREMFNNIAAHKENLKKIEDAAKKEQPRSTNKPQAGTGTTAAPKVVIPPKLKDAFTKVDALAAAGKYGEAIGALPKADKFPQQKKLIEDKLAFLKSKHGGFADLFNASPAAAGTEKENANSEDDPSNDEPDEPMEDDPETNNEPEPEPLEEAPF